VLRLRPGQEVTVADGAGRWRRCAFGPELEPLGEVEAEPQPRPEITVAFALVKGQRPEWAVQKLTEVGVDRIVPLLAARSVVQGSSVARLRRVAREAAVQSRRAWLPAVDDVCPAATVAAWPGAALASPDGGPPRLDLPVVLVGPEGGWDRRELGLDVPRVGLGPRVLRTETAAVVAGALLCALRAGVVTSPADPGG
jgi:16S rRNA (uracil1498-N3)-methyltransferase